MSKINISFGKNLKSEISMAEDRRIGTKNKVDYILLTVIVILLILGAMMVYSAGYPYASSHYGDGAYYIKRQGIYIAIGCLAMYGISFVPVSVYKKASPYFYGICILLLVIVLFGGFSEGVAKRWLGIPGTPLSFQPSELMKLGIIIMLAWYLEQQNDKKGIVKEIIIPGLFLFGACGLVLLEKHLSGTFIIALIGLFVLFVYGTNLKKMSVIYGITAIVGATVFLLTNSYAMKRIQSFLDPNADLLSDKWQTTQGLYAIGSGGFFGLGYMNSIQKYSYVSEPQNDFIFTIWCEEMGFIGAVILVGLFIVLIWRGYAVAFHCTDIYSSLVAFGITSQVGIQAFLNMAVVTDLIPNTGISLPFFSYGGSSLVILLVEMGILLSISRSSRQVNRRLL
ncbi:MAG: cell division protein FtsW [Clostridia bacterium]|nr:cell division protein FtsW [Clostridia bacterium]